MEGKDTIKIGIVSILVNYRFKANAGITIFLKILFIVIF